MAELGHPHRHFAVTDSTNSRARELAEAGAPGGTVVTAAEQTAGRGRQGRSWTAPAGKALLYSALVRPLGPSHALLPLAAAIAVCETAEALEDGIECAIKWPNDVWVDGRKLAGILIEARPQDGWAVIGVGLNLAIGREEFPPELRETATSLGGGAGAAEARRALDDRLGAWIDAEDDTVLEQWAERDALRGREVSWKGGSGVAEGVAETGDLLVLTAGGDRVALGAGEVHLSV
jgi:BirA family biotin operon repressor/biotin-[acetyl-CoA-carboxylase] ligase